MKKIISFMTVLVLSLIVLVPSVNAMTSNELIDYTGKTFNVSGSKIKLGDEYRNVIKRYLNTYPVSDENASKIKDKIDLIVSTMNDTGVRDPKKLSRAKKKEILSIAQDAASIAGATLTYDSSEARLLIYKDGVFFDSVSTKGNNQLVQTGSSNLLYVVIASGIVAIAGSILVYRKRTNNA